MKKKKIFKIIKNHLGAIITGLIVLLASSMYLVGKIRENVKYKNIEDIPKYMIESQNIESYIFTGSIYAIMVILFFLLFIAYYYKDKKIIKLKSIIYFTASYFLTLTIFTAIMESYTLNKKNIKYIKNITLNNIKKEYKDTKYILNGKEYLIIKNIKENKIIFINKNKIDKFEIIIK